MKHGADPRLRGYLVNWLSPLGADPKPLVAELGRLNSLPRPAERGEGGRRPGEGSSGLPPRKRWTRSSSTPRPPSGERLILALGLTRPTACRRRNGPLIAKLLDLYENDPDAGIHGAAEWVLRQWEQQPKLREIDARLKGQDKGQRRWFVNLQGQTFVIVEPVEFRMGSPEGDTEKFSDEPLHLEKIPYRFAIAAKEVTFEQGQPHPRWPSPGRKSNSIVSRRIIPSSP